MSACERCPVHTRAVANRTKCELYDAYDLQQGKYVFNLAKFDPSRLWSLNELKDGKKVGNFFGPFYESQESAMFFFSPKSAVELDIGSYEYEEEETSIVDGHVFGLVTVTAEETPTNVSHTRGKTHYRVKKNLGSKLAGISFENFTTGEITFSYEEGDMCQGETRYSTNITFVCDKSVQSMSRVTHQTASTSKGLECANSFVWRSPYACSECMLNETVKYYVTFRHDFP